MTNPILFLLSFAFGQVYSCNSGGGLSTTMLPPTTPSSDPCEQPLLVGPCGKTFHRFYYNKDMKKCFFFEFSGCGGNLNNFMTQHECEVICLNSTSNVSPEMVSTVAKFDFNQGFPENWNISLMELHESDAAHKKAVIAASYQNMGSMETEFVLETSGYFDMLFDIKVEGYDETLVPTDNPILYIQLFYHNSTNHVNGIGQIFMNGRMLGTAEDSRTTKMPVLVTDIFHPSEETPHHKGDIVKREIASDSIITEEPPQLVTDIFYPDGDSEIAASETDERRATIRVKRSVPASEEMIEIFDLSMFSKTFHNNSKWTTLQFDFLKEFPMGHYKVVIVSRRGLNETAQKVWIDNIEVRASTALKDDAKLAGEPTTSTTTTSTTNTTTSSTTVTSTIMSNSTMNTTTTTSNSTMNSTTAPSNSTANSTLSSMATTTTSSLNTTTTMTVESSTTTANSTSEQQVLTGSLGYPSEVVLIVFVVALASALLLLAFRHHQIRIKLREYKVTNGGQNFDNPAFSGSHTPAERFGSLGRH